MKLKFPPLSGGIIQGLNDAGIETFEGDYAHYVVRECTQNSLDAAASHHEPVEMEIAMRFLPADELPFIDELRDTLERCRGFWHQDEKAAEFFDRAIQRARKKDIALLRISDFGTTGVPGDDNDMNSPWFGLVRSRGVSVKNDDSSGGAFGIGKDAPLAASSFRTVLYSTRTQQNAVALQGICRLATHDDENKAPTQGTGFIGKYSRSTGRFSALRSESEIPAVFHRDKPGLDVWSVGFQGNVGEWEEDFMAAALRNFWPAIHFEKLKLRIGQHIISRQTLPRLMERFRRNDDAVKEAYPYFQAVVAPGSHLREKTLLLAGDCRLHVRLGAHELPRSICMTRKTGMVIYNYAPKTVRVPFAGLFQCDDRKGNQLLKAIEPPTHNNWVMKRAKTPQQKEVLQEIKAWITSELKTMIPNIDAEIVNEDAIADLLPDDLPGETTDNDETDLGGRPAVPPDARQTELQKPQVRTPGEGDTGREKGGDSGGEDDTLDPKKGDGERTGGRVNRSGKDGDKKGEKTSPRIHVDLRSYAATEEPGSYNLILRASEGHTGDIRLDAVTEDGAPISCPLAAAFDEKNQPVVVADNRIAGVTLPAGASVRLRVVLKQPMRVALRASTV